MKSYLLNSWATAKNLDLTQIYDEGFPTIFFCSNDAQFWHLSVSIGADRVGFLLSIYCKRHLHWVLYPVRHNNLTNLPVGIRGKDGLSSLSGLKTESHPRSFRMRTALSRVTCTKCPTSSLLSVPSKLSSVSVSSSSPLLSGSKSKEKTQLSGDIFGDFPWGGDRGFDENVKTSLLFLWWSAVSLLWCSTEAFWAEGKLRQAEVPVALKCSFLSNWIFSVNLSGNTHLSETYNFNDKYVNCELLWSLSFSQKVVQQSKFF